MSSYPQSIDDWQAASRSDPQAAVRAYLAAVEALDAAQRAAAFAVLPSEADLVDGFARSVANLDLPLSGVPFLLKDLFDYPGHPTRASSRFLAEVRPGPFQEAAISQAIRNRGAVFAGKTHLVEFAYGLTGENKIYGDCPHPWLPDRLSGGSSSGSAFAVGRGLVPIAFGTDTGGSIRLPAAWCGIFGLRLTPNEWSSEGCFPLARSFDTPGWFCRNATDMARVTDALLSPAKSERRPLRGLDLTPCISDLPGPFRRKASALLERLGAREDPNASDAYQLVSKPAALSYAVLQSRDALETHRPWIDRYKERYDPVVWQRIDRARHWTAQDFDQAHRCESDLKAFVDACFRKYDYIALPACQAPAQSARQQDQSFRDQLLSLTAPASLTRSPALTVPIFLGGRESMGLQLLYKDPRSDLPLRILGQLEDAHFL